MKSALVTDFPAAPLYRKNLAANLIKWSTFLEASGDNVAAEAAGRRAIDLYRGFFLTPEFATDDRRALQKAYIKFIWFLLDKVSRPASQASDAYTGFFLAMAHWRLGQNEEARQSYDQAIAWMEKNAKDNLDLLRIRAEAEDLMNQGTPDQGEAEELLKGDSDLP
jgi:tetratricopeptide (TPR) repeat protein